MQREWLVLQGTFGYLDPEYFRSSQFTDKSDALDILDSQITKERGMEEMIAFANIAYRCLNLNGRRRPTMKQVVGELESIRNTHESPTAQQNYEVVEFGKRELYFNFDEFHHISQSYTVFPKLFSERKEKKVMN